MLLQETKNSNLYNKNYTQNAERSNNILKQNVK